MRDFLIQCSYDLRRVHVVMTDLPLSNLLDSNEIFTEHCLSFGLMVMFLIFLFQATGGVPVVAVRHRAYEMAR